MSNAVTAAQAAAVLMQADDVGILIHQFPDGDAIGSGFALCLALRSIGKKANVLCADPFPAKYAYLTDAAPLQNFVPQFLCAVDVADVKLLGKLSEQYAEVDLCIDHHGTHRHFEKNLLLDAGCAAAAMPVADVIDCLNVPTTPLIAEALYTGISTDTGCFRYANTDAAVLRKAAELLDIGIRSEMINRLMFETKSRARVELERLALEGMRFYFGGRCAVLTITNEMKSASGAAEDDLDGLASIPRQIEGVWVGVTLRQKEAEHYKISVRTGPEASACDICALLNGGGHLRAAGCSFDGTQQQAVEAVLAAIQQTLPYIAE